MGNIIGSRLMIHYLGREYIIVITVILVDVCMKYLGYVTKKCLKCTSFSCAWLHSVL